VPVGGSIITRQRDTWVVRLATQRVRHALLEAMRHAGTTTPFIISAGSNLPEHGRLARSCVFGRLVVLVRSDGLERAPGGAKRLVGC
jgi:hypothetical protein